MDRALRVHVKGVHAVYEAEWHSFIRKAGHSVSTEPEYADVHLCMSSGFAEKSEPEWWRLAETGKPVILGRANPGCTRPKWIRRTLELGIRNHIIAHRGFGEHIAEVAEQEGMPPVHVSHIPKCYDLDEEACRRFGVSRPSSSPAEDPDSLIDIISLINQYQGFFKGDFDNFVRVREEVPDVHWYGEGSPEGKVSDIEALGRARFLLHLKSGGCVDNAPARAVACGVPVITTEEVAKRNLTDEIVVHGVSGHLAKDIPELIATLRGMPRDEYLRLRRSTWEFGERFRKCPPDVIERFNAMLDDAIHHGTSAADSMRYVEETRHLMPSPRLMSEIEVFEEDGGIFVRNELTRYTHSLNSPMARILQLCNGDNSIRRIIKTIDTELRASGCRLTEKRLQSDVMKALVEMRENGLIYFRNSQ